MDRKVLITTEQDFTSSNEYGFEVDEVIRPSELTGISESTLYILDLPPENERVISALFAENDFIFGKNYTTVWALKASISTNNFSYIALNKNKPSTITIADAIALIAGEREVCFIYGNCQITILSRLLSSSKLFSEKYVMIQLPEIFKTDEYAQYDEFIKSLKVANLFLYQHVKKGNRFGERFSTDVICGKLPKKCIKVCFPNSYVGFYYPQLTKVSGECIPGDTIIPYGDDNIQNIVKQKAYDEIKAKLYSTDLYSEEFVLDYLEKSKAELISREEHCDIKISDYIFDHYQQECIGYSPNHPTNVVLKEVAERILQKIGIDDDKIDSELALDQFEMIIYPAVQKHLGLKYKKTSFVFNRKITPKALSIGQYCNYYLYLTNPTFFYRQKKNYDFSPGLSISRNADLIENKTITYDGRYVNINILFRTYGSCRVKMQLPKICCPDRIVSAACVTRERTYLVKIMPDGHVEWDMGKENWALINCSYMVIQ